jgi:glycosyltransferase involved in cell wall biosynthesis
MGGAENKLLELIERLDHKKYELMLANVGSGGPLQVQFEKLGIEIFNFPRKGSFDLRCCFKLYRLMRKKRVNIVQTTLFWADFMGTIAARFARVPLIISWETVSHSGNPYHNSFQRINGYRLMAKLASLIIAVSNEVKDSLIRQRRVNPNKIRAIHYGVDLEKFRPNGYEKHMSQRRAMNIGADAFLVGIAARLERWKGHSVFIKAFAELASRFENVQVILIGDGSLRDQLEKMVRDLNLQNRIQFLGIRSDIVDLLNCIDLFVLPSLPGEGLPNVLLEAMACKKAVIATNVGGIAELVRSGENGFVVESANTDELKSALEKVLVDPNYLNQLSENALKTVTNEFSLQKQVAAFEEVFDGTQFC